MTQSSLYLTDAFPCFIFQVTLVSLRTLLNQQPGLNYMQHVKLLVWTGVGSTKLGKYQCGLYKYLLLIKQFSVGRNFQQIH